MLFKLLVIISALNVVTIILITESCFLTHVIVDAADCKTNGTTFTNSHKEIDTTRNRTRTRPSILTVCGIFMKVKVTHPASKKINRRKNNFQQEKKKKAKMNK